MKKTVRSIFLYILLTCLVFMFTISSPSAATYPETVRIGLYYGTDSATSVSLSAAKGMDIGYYNQGTFVKLIDENSQAPIIVRKDGYFVRAKDGTLTEYNPNEGVPYEGETTGPYHIRIGGQYPNYSSAITQVQNIQKSDIQAYVVYEQGWWVWTGFYPDSKTANAQISGISSKLETNSLTVIPPTPSRTVVYSADYKPVLLYGGVDGHLQVKPKAENNPYMLSINGKNYRGHVEIRRYPDSDLTVINELNLEQYLYGVVPYEIESNSPVEALKAQAVAARTYSYKCMGYYARWGFDMVDTVDSQVYRGYDGERESTNIAVDQTKGKKILYNNQLAQVFYFSSSGGMTADNKYVWGTDIPYIKSVEDPYESQTSYHYVWEKTLTKEDIKRTLFVKGVEIGDIISVSAEEYSPSGRVTKLIITGTGGIHGNSITYRDADTRYIFNLYSQKYTISSNSNAVVKGADGKQSTLSLDGKMVVTSSGVKTLSQSGTSISILGAGNKSRDIGVSSSNDFVFSGKGWGHGLGMSQEGAKGFAKQGYTYDQILKHYFTGVTIE